MNVDLLHYIDAKNIILNVKGKNKRAILSGCLEHLIQTGKVDSAAKKDVLKALLQREEMGSTAIGGGIALPHARLEKIKNIVVCIGISPEGIDFDSLDEEPVSILVMLLSHQKEAGLHLKMLAMLARILRDKYFVQQVRQSRSEEEIVTLLKKQLTLVQ